MIERAISALDKGFTLAAVKEGELFTSDKKGVSGLLELLERGDDFLRGACLADKVVGKAAAMLMVCGGVREVYARTISKSAICIFERCGVKFSFGVQTQFILNNAKTGLCPMEQTVKFIENPKDAPAAIKRARKVLYMRKGENKMKKLGFGFMRLPLNSGNQKDVDRELVKKMVDVFLERGFNYFDTAYLYHEYTSELVIRECLVQRYPRECFKLADKLPTFELKKREDMPRIFEEQLQKCGVEFFDYYLLHNLNSGNIETAEKLGAFEFIKELKAQGKIKNCGFSFHDTPELLDHILTKHPDIDFVQLQINYLDWESHGVQSRKCWEVARNHSKPVCVMEPIKGGTLAKLPEKAEKLLKEYEPDKSVPSWAIRFAAGLDGVFMVLSGMSNFEQLDDNTTYMSEFESLSDEHKDIIKKVVDIINSTGAIACTACRYCTEKCPQNIPIPDYFSLYNLEKFEGKTRWTPQHAYYENFTRTHGKASDCIKCGACERYCPQHLPIRELLKNVAEIFEK